VKALLEECRAQNLTRLVGCRLPVTHELLLSCPKCQRTDFGLACEGHAIAAVGGLIQGLCLGCGGPVVTTVISMPVGAT
jgi:hypothetical protein